MRRQLIERRRRPPPPSTAEAPATTVELTTTADVSELLVFEGTLSIQDEIYLEMPEGFTNSVALEGDLNGQGAFFGTISGDEESYRVDGDWVFSLSSPDLGEGLVAVQQWVGLGTPTGFDGTGVVVVGVSGAFTDLVGTIRTTDAREGTYVMELEPAAPSPDPSEATETVMIEGEAGSVVAWTDCSPEPDVCAAESAWGGGNTMTGDVVGSMGWTGNITDLRTIAIHIGALDGRGDGVFVTVTQVHAGDPFTAESEFFGVSGAFAGLEGMGTVTTFVSDATGAFAPSTAFTYEVAR